MPLTKIVCGVVALMVTTTTALSEPIGERIPIPLESEWNRFQERMTVIPEHIIVVTIDDDGMMLVMICEEEGCRYTRPKYRGENRDTGEIMFRFHDIYGDLN